MQVIIDVERCRHRQDPDSLQEEQQHNRQQQQQQHNKQQEESRRHHKKHKKHKRKHKHSKHRRHHHHSSKRGHDSDSSSTKKRRRDSASSDSNDTTTSSSSSNTKSDENSSSLFLEMASSMSASLNAQKGNNKLVNVFRPSSRNSNSTPTLDDFGNDSSNSSSNDDDINNCQSTNITNVLKRHKKTMAESVAAAALSSSKKRTSHCTDETDADVLRGDGGKGRRRKEAKIPRVVSSVFKHAEETDSDGRHSETDEFEEFEKQSKAFDRNDTKRKQIATNSNRGGNNNSNNTRTKYRGGSLFNNCKSSALTNPLALTAAYIMKLPKNIVAKVQYDNPALYAALYERDPKSMMHTACLNLRNHNNIELLEWSEMVMIQLCIPKQHINFKMMTWSILQDLININQWSLNVLTVMRECYTANTSLRNVIIENRLQKNIDYPNVLSDTRVFVSKNIIPLNYDFILQFNANINSEQQYLGSRSSGMCSINRLLRLPTKKPIEPATATETK